MRPNDLDGMRRVVAHLIERGYSSFGYVVGSTRPSSTVRYDALRTALQESRHDGVPIYRAAGTDPDQLAATAIRLRRDRPEVVVCYDDHTALNLVDALRTAGLAVPEDLGVVGFDDIPFARIANPRLTTVAQRSEQMGATSVDWILRALESDRLPASTLVPVSLAIRETTPGPMRRKRHRARLVRRSAR
jgi:LacI family transcriptional regulator